jgi:magnesium transporter
MANFTKFSDKISSIRIDNPRTENTLEWINIVHPGKKEADYLRKRFNFDLSHLRASMSNVYAQRPMVIQQDGYLFLILHFPAFSGDRVIAGEIEFFLGHGYLVTLHNNNLSALGDFFNYCKKNPDDLLSYEAESSAILLYEILNRLIKEVYDLLDRSSVNINQVEEIIFNRDQKEAVAQILDLRRNIVNVRKIMQNHKNILQKLMEMESSLVPNNMIRKHYAELVDHSKRIWEMLENQKDMIEIFNSTNESLLNDQMNMIMKTLTIFSVIVFPLTLLAAIFGMNARYMPLVEGPYGFWIILSMMAIGSIIMLWVFSRKKWL